MERKRLRASIGFRGKDTAFSHRLSVTESDPTARGFSLCVCMWSEERAKRERERKRKRS